MDSTSISIALSGSGGTGVMTAGSLLLDAAAKAGYYGLMTRTLGPQIRGGEAAALMRLGIREVSGPDDSFHVLLALDWGNIERFAAEIALNARSAVITDPANGPVPELIAATGVRVIDIPLAALAARIEDGRPNMVAVGLLGALLGLPASLLIDVIGARLADRDEATRQASLGAMQAGIDAAAQCPCQITLAPPRAAEPGNTRWALSGNEATGAGALRGGVRFVAAYPITPATDILEYLAVQLPRVGGALVQAEDELASINMILGASFGGAPSLTATSGPGLALMTESIGLGVASETPVVICNVMRGGPSTGIPTKSEQSDLNIALYGLHGDAPHVVTAPTSISDCVFTTQWSVHLAECLQVPVITLSDQAMGQARSVIDAPATVTLHGQRKIATTVEHYARYEVTDDGISPMALPGTPGLEYTADGLEHSPRGTPSTQAAHHLEQLDKRQRKLTQFDYGPWWAHTEGDGSTAILVWGSVTAPALEAAARLRRDGVAVKVIALRLLAPALPERLSAELTGVRRVLVVEQSHSQQFMHYLRGHFNLPNQTHGYARPGPVSIRPGEIVAAIDAMPQEA